MTDWDKRVEEASLTQRIYEPKYGGKDHSGYDTLMKYEVNSERQDAFTAGANWAREDMEQRVEQLRLATVESINALRKENDLLRIATPTMEAVHLLSKQNDALSQQCEPMADALKAVDVWFERLKADHDAKLGESFEAACENWNDLLQEPLDLTPVKDALAQYKKFKEEK